jgi:hypothetical protein
MSTAKRTTMQKINRERELKEKRERKAERKEQKKIAAAEAAANPEGVVDPDAEATDELVEDDGDVVATPAE